MLQRQNLVALSPLERIGPWTDEVVRFTCAGGPLPRTSRQAETGSIYATRDVTHQHPDYVGLRRLRLYPAGNRLALVGLPYHAWSQQTNTEIVDTDPDPRRLVGTSRRQDGPKKAEIKVKPDAGVTGSAVHGVVRAAPE